MLVISYLVGGYCALSSKTYAVADSVDVFIQSTSFLADTAAVDATRR